jgi:signal transduction histidine kinase
VEIADDGDGIGEEELPHLFERFYKGKKGNFGLGLAISKSAMESMGGNLTAFNRNGAVFRLEVPYAERLDA